MTIKENIIYNKINISMEEVRFAAERANALNFIINNQFDDAFTDKNINLGKGFDRNVGLKGG
jgi:ABC-type multidrug transport system fused ATPase/permease subunit